MTDIATDFADLCRDVTRATYGTVLLADCEPQFSRVLAFVRAQPDSRADLIECFQSILSSDITRFCMRQLQWPEIAIAAREKMRGDIHNSEYESLQRLLAVYQ
jgi:hypothetical protein